MQHEEFTQSKLALLQGARFTLPNIENIISGMQAKQKQRITARLKNHLSKKHRKRLKRNKQSITNYLTHSRNTYIKRQCIRVT